MLSPNDPVARPPQAPGIQDRRIRPDDAAAWKDAEASAARRRSPEGRAFAPAFAQVERPGVAGGTPVAAQPDDQKDIADLIGDAANRAIDSLPPGARELAEVLKETPPDVQVLGTVINTPIGKAGVFLLQPTAPANPFVPDLSKAPIVFVSIPGRNVVATYNPNNDQVEFGPGSTTPIGPDTIAFYNGRVGGRGGNLAGADAASVSANFGVLNSTVSDPIVKYAVDAASRGVARALTAVAAALDVATIPSGEGVAAAVAIEGLRTAFSAGFRANTKWFVGVGWRGADVEVYRNGETTLNLSGAAFRLREGQGPGGSGRPPSDFVWDASN